MISGFLGEDLIDEMVITRTSQILGDGVPLFGKIPDGSLWKRVKVVVLNDYLVQTTYVRDREVPMGKVVYTK